MITCVCVSIFRLRLQSHTVWFALLEIPAHRGMKPIDNTLLEQLWFDNEAREVRLRAIVEQYLQEQPPPGGMWRLFTPWHSAADCRSCR